LAVDSIYAFIGKYDLKADEKNVIRGSFSSFRIHPDWDHESENFDADIAVLVLKDKIIFGTFVQPACLPASTTNVFNIRGTVVGYGLTETSDTNVNRPKFVEIPSLTHIDCFWKSKTFKVAGSTRSFCAGEQGKRACRGDSGGGFYKRNGDSYTVNGIVSAGSFHCDQGEFAVFTSVPNFVDWIRQEMSKDDDEKEVKVEGGQGDNGTLVCEFKKNYNG
jgi:secreted trypsin-like serine protease